MDLQAQETRALSILVLDQSEPRGPFYFQIFFAIRSEINTDTYGHTLLHAENLDLSRFNGKDYEDSLKRHRIWAENQAEGGAVFHLNCRWL